MPNRDATRATAITRAYHRAAAFADRVDERHQQRSPVALTPGHAGVAAATWGSLKLLVVGVFSPLAGPVVLARANQGTRYVIKLTLRYPSLIRSLIEVQPRDTEPSTATTIATPTRIAGLGPQRVVRAPAGASYFLSSDLHRCHSGTVDWAHHQGTGRLYDAALDYYADRDWGLVENGDVEDFWLTGGSTYGVVYDACRLVAFGAQRLHEVVSPRSRADGRRSSTTLNAVFTEHLRRIVANNQRTYDRIDQRFHRYGRYVRLVGNHDDVFLDEAMVGALAEVHQGITVNDFLLFTDDAGATVGVVTHGHHTDGWNAPDRSGLGRLGTWLGSALLDVPFASNPGMPDVEETDRLLGGRLGDLLTRVSRRFGANRELYSLDEILLFDAWRVEWAGEAAEPWLVLGHTHLPLIRPIDPESGATWERYANSGSGIFHECLTGIEWDGTADASNPSVRLVVWRYADRDPETPADAIVAWDGDRGIVREVLDRVPPSDRLQVVSRGHDRRAVDA